MKKNNYYYESDTKHAQIIPQTAIDVLYNSIVRIENNNRIGTGFFLKLNIKKKMKYFLFTCHHVISKNDVNSKIAINFFYGKKKEEKKKVIILDRSQRFISCLDYKIDDSDRIIDATVIEIKKSDEIPEDKYLIADLTYKYGYDIYEQKNYFLAGYPNEPLYPLYQKERHISSGLIIGIKGFIFAHSIDARGGSSGSPICQVENLRVVGMHNGGNIQKPLNYGVFIGVIIDELEKQLDNIDININESKLKN